MLKQHLFPLQYMFWAYACAFELSVLHHKSENKKHCSGCRLSPLVVTTCALQINNYHYQKQLLCTFYMFIYLHLYDG